LRVILPAPSDASAFRYVDVRCAINYWQVYNADIFCTVAFSKLEHYYLLTYSMVQSPSWAANWFAASQEIPRISGNPKAHYRTHKRPPPVSILGQSNPVHIHTSHLVETHPNIIHPSTPRSSQWSLSLRFHHQDPIHTPSSPIRATCPAHLILLDFITRTIYWMFQIAFVINTVFF